jgi:hypothetical protein
MIYQKPLAPGMARTCNPVIRSGVKEVVGIHVLLTRSPFGDGIPRRLPLRVSLAKPPDQDQMNLNYQRFVPYTDSLRKQNRDLAIQGTEFQAAVAELTQIRENMERGLGILIDNLNPLLEEKFRPQPKTQEPDRKAA